MWYYYAELDENNIVKGVSCLAATDIRPFLISIPEYDESLIGKTYDPQTGTFS